jgi:CRISPR-associated protein Cas2
MRTAFVVAYDISEPRRLAKVAKTCRDFGDRIQKSVFECLLTDSDLILLRARLRRTIAREQDQVLLIRLGPAHGAGAADKVEALGRPYTPCERVAVIV